MLDRGDDADGAAQDPDAGRGEGGRPAQGGWAGNTNLFEVCLVLTSTVFFARMSVCLNDG